MIKKEDVMFQNKKNFKIKSSDNYLKKNYIQFTNNYSPIYKGFYLDVFESLDNYFKKKLVKKFKFTNIHYPISLSEKDCKKNKIIEKSSKILRFIKNYHGKKNIDILSPTVCYHFFNSNFNKKIESKESKITAKNVCFRNENTSKKSFYRLSHFTMREGIIVGNKTEIINFLKKAEDDLKKFLLTVNLNFKIAYANDIFINDSQIKFQNIFKPKKEFLMPINSKEYISFFSSNFHSKTLIRDFKIRKNSFSGCVGYGLDRMTYCLFKQFGHKKLMWPKKILKLLNI